MSVSAQLGKDELLEAYRMMRTIREFEERLHVEFATGEIPGFVHLYAGEEASAVGTMLHLNDADYVATTHRGHGHCIAKGVDVRGMMAEIYGRKTGVCHGKGGSMHIADLSKGMLGANGIVGAGGPLVCSGSLPPGLPVEAYGLLVETARRHGAATIVDAAREALLGSLPFEPDLVTPNLAEAEGIVSGVVTEPVEADSVPVDEVRERAAVAAQGLIARGARRAVVTAGGHGVCAAVDGSTTWIAAPRVSVVNPIGAGDSFAAGVAVGLGRDLGWLGAIELGVTVASAAVEMPGAGRVDADRVTELAEAVKA